MTHPSPAAWSPQEEEALRDLLDRAMRAAIHRLRGGRGLLSGWALLGVPKDHESRVKDRLEEDRLLLGRLDWIRGVLRAGPRLEVILAGEAPQVILAAALELGTPEEAGDRLPRHKDARAALALALWARWAVGEEPGHEPVALEFADGALVARAQCPVPREVDATWTARFADLLLAPASAESIRFRRGLFAAAAPAEERTGAALPAAEG